ncbi:FKBP-type peptidyl-prolyl cis-trans isomerase [Methylophilus medardicus]|uniref:Peptidyl-prolyl cis-trans isomerase n=1 Tax=Methylophilus medardicus TaxID=2588534 RepID=A0A5B8CR97_9PROT|nr:FKBP-type peptidyl-prolyl cis-trans isomerase [Methylophilus medardicus]QDC43556.1 FKBP-type peptidyl-prolyl cis-trans isomerase [Methylophilus medardicus]QDC48563.1 FKBP-type peptidyl-prolyl cis-trans isomerase [Methylophilus medardicus]QDC52268.1 FKBP-type peptidyl-prolyl cis-trans isomerase [Methylophilus medardicus]
MANPLDSLTQRLSYIVGENLAHQLKNDGLEIDTDALVLAVNDVVAGNSSRLSDADKRSAVEQVQKESQEKQRAAQSAQSAQNQAAGAAYLADNAKKEGVTTTASGLQYKQLVAGDGAKPTTKDRVKVHYHGTLIDGTVFDSSYERGEPIVFPVTGVIAGWVEGLQLMNVGSKFELTIPSNLAYGASGSGPVIGPDATLVFAVELLAIE